MSASTAQPPRPPPSPPPGEEARWTTQQVAAYLAISESAVLVLARKKTIPAVRIGVLWRFDPETVRKYGRGELAPPSDAPVVPLSPGRRRRV